MNRGLCYFLQDGRVVSTELEGGEFSEERSRSSVVIVDRSEDAEIEGLCATMRVVRGWRMDRVEFVISFSDRSAERVVVVHDKCGCGGCEVYPVEVARRLSSGYVCVEQVIFDLVRRDLAERDQVVIELIRPLQSKRPGGLIDLVLPSDLLWWFLQAGF